MKTAAERATFLDTGGRRILSRDSIVLFVNGRTIVRVGVIVRRDKDEISLNPDYLTVGVSPVSGSLEEFLFDMSNEGRSVSAHLFQVPPLLLGDLFMKLVSLSFSTTF
jgi:hypothetical protein